MAHLVHSLEIGKVICDALGIDVQKTDSIVITIKPDEYVTINIQQKMKIEEEPKIISVLKQYHLVEINDGKSS